MATEKDASNVGNATMSALEAMVQTYVKQTQDMVGAFADHREKYKEGGLRLAEIAYGPFRRISDEAIFLELFQRNDKFREDARQLIYRYWNESNKAGTDKPGSATTPSK